MRESGRLGLWQQDERKVERMDEWRDGIKDEGLRKLRRKVSGAGHSYGHEDMDGWRDK